jgi:hypothetical protein
MLCLDVRGVTRLLFWKKKSNFIVTAGGVLRHCKAVREHGKLSILGVFAPTEMRERIADGQRRATETRRCQHLQGDTMNCSASKSSRIAYGRKLVNAGVQGLRSERQSLQAHAISALMADSARDSVKLAVAGACLGLLPSYVTRRRPHLSTLLAFGA